MKLIRLQTTGSATFDNFFNEDIIIKKDAEIALDMVSAEIASPFLQINSENDLILYDIGQQVIIPSNFQNGNWNQSNTDTLFNETTKNLNTSLPYVEDVIGLQWRFNVNALKKTQFNLQFGKESSPLIFGPLSTESLVNCAIQAGPPKIMVRNAGTDNSFDSYWTVSTGNCKGSSTLRARTVDFGSLDNKGIIIGYLLNKIQQGTATINLSDIKYGLQLVNDATRYNFIINGNSSPSTNLYIPQEGDFLDLQQSDGIMKYVVYRADNDEPEQIFEASYDHITDLYPVILFVGGTSLSGIQYWGDAYKYGEFKNTKYQRQNLGDIPDSYVISTIRNIEISPLVAQSLGYTEGLQPFEYVGQQLEETTTWTADKQLDLVDYSESYYIELLNINLDSYDGLTRQRKNILDNIAQISLVNERLLYTANYPKFLSINNGQDISLRRIKARIVKEDGSEPEIKGIAVLSILVKDK